MQDRLHLPDDRSLYICSRTQQDHLIPGIRVRILPEYRTVSYFLLSVLHQTTFRMSLNWHADRQLHQTHHRELHEQAYPVDTASGSEVHAGHLFWMQTGYPVRTGHQCRLL